MNENRVHLLKRIWDSQNEAWSLMCEYDSLPHKYGENILHQAEAEVIDLIAFYPDITITHLAHILHKTPSACSQIVKKLRQKGWVEQIRDEENNRQYKLTLTDAGQVIYRDHAAFEASCQETTFANLNMYSEEELQIYLKIQKKIIESYQEDVKKARSVSEHTV